MAVKRPNPSLPAPSLREQWDGIDFPMGLSKKEWIKELRELGFQAAHPYDDWAKKKGRPDQLHLAYPQFNDGVDLGALVMLGWPKNSKEELRPVIIVGKEEDSKDKKVWWHYEDID